MKVQSAIAATATAGDLTMAQMIARGVTQSEMNRMWQEMLEEVECLQSLSLSQCDDVPMHSVMRSEE